MKNKFYSVIAIMLLFQFPVRMYGQNTTLTMEDVVLAGSRGMVPEKLDQLKWIPASNLFSYIKKETTGEVLVAGNAANKETKTLATIRQLNASLKTAKRDTLSKYPAITWITSDKFIFSNAEKTYDYTVSTGNVNLLIENPGPKAAHKELNNAGTAMAYTLDNNLFIISADKKYQITGDTADGIVNGQIVHREEFGISKGTFWSPSGKFLAFYRMDETMVTDYPVLNLDVQPASVKMVKYPMSGGVSHHVTIGIYNLETNKTIFLKTGEPADQYLTNIAWSPDNKKILVAVLNRDQNHLKMNRYDITTGDFEQTLFEEKENAYVQPLHPALFNKAGNLFLWQSRRDGFNHIYLYENSGKLVKQVTKGKWEVTELLGFNSGEDRISYISNAISPVNRDIFTVSIKNGSVKRISSSDGVHKGSANTSGDYFIDEFSAPKTARRITTVNADGKTGMQLLNSENPLDKFSPVKQELFTIKAASGDDLYCRMLKPANFDSMRTYPVIVYVYGGPMVSLITNNWLLGADLWQYYMAQRGFIIFTLENRGTPVRGKDFEQATFRKLGDIELEDQISGVKFLMQQRYIDKNRMGVYGWSYGGFMTVSLMTRYPGTFRAAVAGGPVIDWSYYEVMYTERYMDTPKNNPEGYGKSNLLNYVDKLTGKLMLIHGTADNVVVWQHSLLYLKKAVEKNIQVDYFVYPGHEHNVKGKDRIHLLNKISDYFFKEFQ